MSDIGELIGPTAKIMLADFGRGLLEFGKLTAMFVCTPLILVGLLVAITTGAIVDWYWSAQDRALKASASEER